MDLNFVASMTLRPGEMKQIRSLVAQSGTRIDPLQRVLVTPLFLSQSSLAIARELGEAGSQVYFDSGGYYVQSGRIKYEDLYLPLLNAYRRNRWASIYTLPDYVPTSQDDPAEVDRKVRATADFSGMFFHEMPDELKLRAMPVIQGHELRHIDYCLDTYIKLGVKHVGFGSFATGGKNNESNLITKGSVDHLQYITAIARQNGIETHAFGVGRPALVPMISAMGVDSFDSSSWMKAAGHGQVFLPFMRGYNITYRTVVSELELGIGFEQLNEWLELSQHSCTLCQSLEDLQNKRMHRVVHNLICVAESVDLLNRGELDLIRELYRVGSPKYRNEFERWLNN